MPFVMLVFGEMLLVSGVTGNQKDLWALLKNDFVGGSSFLYWLAAIAVVGALGYIPGLKGLSNAFLVLILVVLIIHQDPTKLTQNFSQAINNAQANPAAPTTQPVNNITQPSSPGAAGSGGLAGAVNTISNLFGGNQNTGTAVASAASSSNFIGDALDAATALFA